MFLVNHLLKIQASKEQVFEAISSIQGLKNWLTVKTIGSGDSMQYLGFRFEEQDGPDMLVKQLIPFKTIEWICVASPHGWKGNRITFQLETSGLTTILRFSHDGWHTQNDSYAYCNSTWGHYLDSLKNYCESGKGSPFAV